MSTITITLPTKLKQLLKLSQILFVVVFLWSCESSPTKDSHKSFKGKGLAGLNEQQLKTYRNALIQLKDNQPQAAEQVLNKLVKAQPDIAELWLNIALSQYQQGNYAASKTTLGRLLKRSNAIAQAYNLAGLLAVKNGEFQQAQTHYKEAINLKPNYANALYNMALLQDVYLQDVEAAIAYYEKYSQLNTDDQQTKDWIQQLKSSL